tara:strand:+ start:95 stop:2494 length:2400 start_codon:yes stop_codon:yes gene_type:complete
MAISNRVEGYSHVVLNFGDNQIEINDILNLSSNSNDFNKLVERLKSKDGFLPYSFLQGRKIRLSNVPSKRDFLTLRLWGQWISKFDEENADSSSSMHLWKNPNLLIAPKIYHQHKPKYEPVSDLFLWTIPLGKCNFISDQNYHLSLPTWNLARNFIISRIELISEVPKGTGLSTNQIFNEKNIKTLFLKNQWIDNFRIVDRWFVLIITIQVILAFCLLRYFMVAQAYLCVMFFCLLASYWYQWPFRYDIEKATLVEANAKLRRVVHQGADIPRIAGFELNQILENFTKEIKDLSSDINAKETFMTTLSSKARKIGLEVMLQYENARKLINVSTKQSKSFQQPEINKVIKVLYSLVRENLLMQQFQEVDRERNDQFNKKLLAIEELFDGLFAEDQSLRSFLNDPNKIVEWQADQNSRIHYFYWNYFYDDEKNLVVTIIRLKPGVYGRHIEKYVHSYYSEALKLQDWTHETVYFRNKYGSFHPPVKNVSETFMRLHEQYTEATEFLHYVYQNDNHELYFGSKFESIPNQRIILKVNANNLASEIMDDKRELSLQKLSMIFLIPLLALSISALVSWRLRTLRRRLEIMTESGQLTKLEVEGRDQISDLSIQVNRLLHEPIKRKKLIRLKEDFEKRDRKILSSLNEINTEDSYLELVYIVLECELDSVPDMFSETVHWICKDYKNRLTGWCSTEDLMTAFLNISKLDESEKRNLCNYKIDLLEMEYELEKHAYRALNGVPSIQPILPANYLPFFNESIHTEANKLQVFTTLEDKYRKVILTCLDGSRRWHKAISEGLDGYQLR